MNIQGTQHYIANTYERNPRKVATREEDIRHIPVVPSTETLFFSVPRCEVTNMNLTKKPNVIMEVVAIFLKRNKNLTSLIIQASSVSRVQGLKTKTTQELYALM
jgi:hypothetical protein